MEAVKIAIGATLITLLSILLIIWIILKIRDGEEIMNEKSKKCPGCDGTGIGQELDHDDENVSMTMYREIDCPECKGKGYIIEEEE